MLKKEVCDNKQEATGLSKTKNCPICKGFIHFKEEKCYRTNGEFRDRNNYFHENCLRRYLLSKLEKASKREMDVIRLEEFLNSDSAKEWVEKGMREYYTIYEGKD